MKTHIRHIVYDVSPCKWGDKYRPVLEFFNEKDATKFLRDWYSLYDYKHICLLLMKVLD